ncbi:hypothetical protein GGS23DRAFT_383044 [Durotheca rogersii]|uniref:uncharacterized protein n=1 Tax=Durotheca rogersii TaxID=419775 RepID=UPI00221E7D0E|nr:uncharacterized protein GGS23DRAFT_383044 [Durotheca rogersii]KAI5866346.1 hypothetical protein GGS23DRAFT_383044 [Durotheca rogersii]
MDNPSSRRRRKRYLRNLTGVVLYQGILLQDMAYPTPDFGQSGPVLWVKIMSLRVCVHACNLSRYRCEAGLLCCCLWQSQVVLTWERDIGPISVSFISLRDPFHPPHLPACPSIPIVIYLLTYLVVSISASLPRILVRVIFISSVPHPICCPDREAPYRPRVRLLFPRRSSRLTSTTTIHIRTYTPARTHIYNIRTRTRPALFCLP